MEEGKNKRNKKRKKREMMMDRLTRIHLKSDNVKIKEKNKKKLAKAEDENLRIK